MHVFLCYQKLQTRLKETSLTLFTRFILTSDQALRVVTINFSVFFLFEVHCVVSLTVHNPEVQEFPYANE